MRLLVLGSLMALLASFVFAQDETYGPDYAGFYFLNIPDFLMSEGSQVQGTVKSVSGRLALQGGLPVFIAERHPPITLLPSQLSRLMLDPWAQKPFELFGFDGSAVSPDGQVKPFFVTYYATMGDLRMILLIPSTKPAPPPPTRSSNKDAPDAVTSASASRLRFH